MSGGAVKMCDHSSNGWRPEDGLPDLAMMSDITTDGINVNLRTRYQRDEIYTFSGSILISVNPYKQLDIYNQYWIEKFRNKEPSQSEPHVFALTEAMYMNLVMQGHTDPSELDKSNNNNNGNSNNNNHQLNNQQAPNFKDQVCVISGESGAGKTETTKFMLSYLCSAVSPNKSAWMEHQILEANTILEAFGNAKTVRNDNSSRFGKFIQVCFDARHQITGCIIQDYLLEQSRITFQSIGERNYHVFYQLLAAGQTNEELRKQFHLMPANFYNYLNKTQCYSIEGINDCSMFDALRQAMSVLNMSQECCDGLFSILSAILWLGNLQFSEWSSDHCGSSDNDINNNNSNNSNNVDDKQEKCLLTENDKNTLKIISQLLALTTNESTGTPKENNDNANQQQQQQQQYLKLQNIMLKRQINVRGCITEIPFKSLNEAKDNCNSMGKVLYSKLFTWVVNFINSSTNPGQKMGCFLGVLDIFGFENFQTNSFEQLCINYANEKLHKFFNQHMFAMEQELYHREGIEFCDINYTDNSACLELLERPPNCILRLLSEECRMPKGSDATLIEKLHLEFAQLNPNCHYVRGSDRRNWSAEFSIRHFAGCVTYNVSGFLKKNRDSQQNQLLELLESSTNPILIDIVGSSGSNNYTNSTNYSPKGLAVQRGTAGSFDMVINNSMSDSSNNNNNNGDKRYLLHQQHSFQYSRRDSASQIGVNSSSSSSSISTGKSKPTVADAFRYQLGALVDLLKRVHPWYVRCIKPNLEKSATDYDDRQVLMQLRYLGMSDLIRIRREGYPIHLTKHQFVCRYRCLMLKYLRLNPIQPAIKLDEATLERCCLQMLNYFELASEHWRLGKTMVLLRSLVYQPLELRRQNLFISMATLIQAHWRSHLQRRHFLSQRQAAKTIQWAFRAHRGRLLFMRKKRATLTIQAYCRGMFAREIANALREIKQVELEKARRRLEEEERQAAAVAAAAAAAEEQERLSAQQQQQLNIKRLDEDQQMAASLSPAPQTTSTNISPAISSSSSWMHSLQDQSATTAAAAANTTTTTSLASQRLQQARNDKKEMDELIKVLERHGISLEALEQGDERVYAEFERLYDAMGQQQQQQLRAGGLGCDSQSMVSTSVHDVCSSSLATTTNGADSVSCSNEDEDEDEDEDDDDDDDNDETNDYAQSHEVVALKLKNAFTDEQDETTNRRNNDNEYKNDNDNNQNEANNQWHSNSVESIASIVSSASLQPATAAAGGGGPNSSSPIPIEDASSAAPALVPLAPAQTQAPIPVQPLLQPVPSGPVDQTTKVSTFTGQPAVLVGGSKMVTNGRPLTRIEEEPNSLASSPSKTPCKSAAAARQRQLNAGLFAPHRELSRHNEEDELGVENDNDLLETEMELADRKQHELNQDIKRRRIERRILQVQQQQQQKQQTQAPQANPTTAGLPINPAAINATSKANGDSQQTNDELDAIYGAQKANILEFAERVFNNHPRNDVGGGGLGGAMMRTLTRRGRRGSVDSSSSSSSNNYDLNQQHFLSKTEMLSYTSSTSIPMSHIRMHDPLSSQISCSIFKNLCKYMTGDSARSDNEIRIIQSIVRHGLDKQELRDEIYIQIIRQLTNNVNNEQCLRLWTLLGLVSAAFSPSKAFSGHLIEYLKSKPRKDPTITCHAQFCLDNLQTSRLGGVARKLPPSPMEIQACKSLTNLTCKIHLLDGRCELMSIHPCDTSIDTLTKLANRLQLQSIEGWALYESYTCGASKYPHPVYERRGADFERTIKPLAYMADLMASWQDTTVGFSSSSSSSSSGLGKQRGKSTGANSSASSASSSTMALKIAQKRLDEGNFKLTFKKKIFRGPKIRNDPVEISLLYAQAVYNVVKRDSFFVDENLALSLAGLQAQIKLGNACDVLKKQQPAAGQTSTGAKKRGDKKSSSSSCSENKSTTTTTTTTGGKTSIKTPVQIYNVEQYICLRLRNQVSRSKKDWCNLICQSHKQFHNINEVFCKMRYLSMVIYHCPLYGTATFNVLYKGYQALDQNLILGVNAEGLVLIRTTDKALISAYRSSDICSTTATNFNGTNGTNGQQQQPQNQQATVSVFLEEKLVQLNVRDRNDFTVKCLTFETDECEEIASLMGSYYPQLQIHVRGVIDENGEMLGSNLLLDTSTSLMEQNSAANGQKRAKLKMTLEDRMRVHQEVQNCRRAIIKSGKLRKPATDELASNGGLATSVGGGGGGGGGQNSSLFKHTLRRLSHSKNLSSSSTTTGKSGSEKMSRFENIYGSLGGGNKANSNGSNAIPQASSDYNIYNSNSRYSTLSSTISNSGDRDIYQQQQQQQTEVSGATASTRQDEFSKLYPHRYWAYTRYPLKSSLLTIFDTDLEEVALFNFVHILTYSGLLNTPLGAIAPNGICEQAIEQHSLVSPAAATTNSPNNNNSTAQLLADSCSIDSGIASQQSLSNGAGGSNKTSGLSGANTIQQQQQQQQQQQVAVNQQAGSSPSSASSSNDIYDVCPTRKLDERELIRLAQAILDRCLKKGADILRNELFLQLIKQTTDHPEPNCEINRRHWQLLALTCSVTNPSDCKILSYLFAHLRRCSMDQINDEGQWAQFTMRSLQGTLDTKGRKWAPSELEILSTINCRRVYARVYFLDGQFQAVEFDPCATIAEVLDQIKQKIGLKADSTGYALFQPLDDDCEQALRPEEKVGDALASWEAWQRRKLANQTSSASSNQQSIITPASQQQQQQIANNTSINKASLNGPTNQKSRAHKFVFKKYLFSDNMIDLNDLVERELLYHQVVQSIKEDKFPLLEQEANILCALKAQIEIGDYTKLAHLAREHIRMIYKQVVMSLMPPHAFNNLQVQTIAQQHQAFKDLNRVDAKKYFFNLIQSFGRANLPNGPGFVLLHRAHVYDAKQTFAAAWPSDIWIVINCSGLHMLVARSRRVLASCDYRQVIDYNSNNNNNLMLIVLSNTQNRIKYTFYSKQAQQITQQMKDYIVHATSDGTTKRRKSVGFNLK